MNPLFDPKNSQALLALGAGLLAPGVNSGERISLGLLGFNQAYQAGAQQRRQEQRDALQQRMMEEQLAEKERQRQAAERVGDLVGSQGGQYVMSDNELFPGEEPIQGLETAPSGLLGGQIAPDQFYASLLAVPGYEGIGARGLETINRQAYEARASERPYLSPVQTSNGIMVFDHRSGQAWPMMGPGQTTALPISADPVVRSAVAGAETAAKERAKVDVEAQVSLPQAVANAEQSMALIDAALEHPGRTAATGMSGTIDPRNYLPGTNARDFQVLMDQLKGKSFLQAFESLKGGGQITEMEGRKATEAIARLNTAQSDEEFTRSLRELRKVISDGMERARQKAGQQPKQTGLAVGVVEDGYEYIGGDPSRPDSWRRVQ